MYFRSLASSLTHPFPQTQNLYRVKWHHNAGETWEPEAYLVHASDKVEKYAHKQRVKRKKSSVKVYESEAVAAKEENPDHVR